MRKTIEFKIEIPMTPNFIKVGDRTLRIEDFTEKELEEIGKLWIIELLKKAKLKRNK